MNRTKIIIWVIVAFVVVGGVGAGLYYYVNAKTVYIDLSQIQAPLINLSPYKLRCLAGSVRKSGGHGGCQSTGGARRQRRC